MASLQKKRLQKLRQQREGKEFYKPLSEVPKGLKLPISKFTTERTSYNNYYSLVVHYTHGTSKFFTYLTVEYKSLDEKTIRDYEATFNAGIENQSEPLFLAYYGMENKAHSFDILEQNEGINFDQLERCKLDAQENEPEESPKKRKLKEEDE